MLNLLKGMGKAYIEARKARKLDKAAQDKLPPQVGGPAKNPDTIKLNKQLKIVKNIGIGTAGTVAGAAVVGQAKKAFKNKDKNND